MVDSLLIGSQNGLYIYQPKNHQREQLSLPPSPYTNGNGFDAAKWSPDDNYILLSRDIESFHLYNTNTLERTDISSNKPKRFFIWVNDQSFFTSKYNDSHSFKYSLNHLSDPQKISLKDIGIYRSLGTSLSPTKTAVAYISDGPYQQGIDIYDFTTDETHNILNYSEYDPIVLNWVQTRTILFYGRHGNMIKIISPSGEVSLL